jgi:dTDP-4-dehydrorhamnose reductase
VAGSIIAQTGDGWQVHAISRGEPLTQRDNLRWHTFDPLAPDGLTQIIRDASPDAVIHTAALADIDLCQTHPEIASAVNVDLTRRVTSVCAEAGCKLVFCSTDSIFDGEHAPYKENDAPGPVNFYAETKVEAEKIVARLCPQAVIARLSVVIGLPVLGVGNSFLARMLASFTKGRTVALPEHEVRTPVDVITVGRALLELAGGNHHGIFHLSGHDRVSRFRMAQQIAARLGFPSNLVVTPAAATIPGRAARPRDVSLDNGKACANLKTPMRTLDDGLSLILQTAADSSR